MTATCSCRKFECIGMYVHTFVNNYLLFLIYYGRMLLTIYHAGILCKHALKVLNANNVFNLPPQYIMGRWTKYAKRGFYVDKQESGSESNKTWAARISRMATSIALKCS